MRRGLLALVVGVLVALGGLGWITQPIVLPVSAIPVPTVQPGRLETHVRVLVETCCPRDIEHPRNLDCAADYIRTEFEQAQGTVSEQVFEHGAGAFRNVIAQYGPDTQERIVVGAHYDAFGVSPGADDNASGVAGLIELAYLLGSTELPMRVELVAYSLEEYGYVGSRYHAVSLELKDARIRAMICLEMIGYFADGPRTQDMPWLVLRPFYPTTGNGILIAGPMSQGGLVRQIKRAMRGASFLPVYSINLPTSVKEISRSDQRSYWDAGYGAAVMVTDTGGLRNKSYHTSDDLPDTLDYVRAAMVVQGVFAAVKVLAQ